MLQQSMIFVPLCFHEGFDHRLPGRLQVDEGRPANQMFDSSMSLMFINNIIDMFSLFFHISYILLSSGCFKVETMQKQDNTPADARVMAWWTMAIKSLESVHILEHPP